MAPRMAAYPIHDFQVVLYHLYVIGGEWYDLGVFDQDEARVEPASNPFITPEKV
ncbi:MAG: hypothetical protein OXG25_02055 [Gammaproteobacteria bacterium]|nr:hypothetical protein [Gammaproteobacteria bacterium]